MTHPRALEGPSADDSFASPSPPEGWRSLSELPPPDSLVEGLLSDGSVVDAEYWEGPDERPDWGGWAFDMTARFGAHDWTQQLDLVGWRLPGDGGEAVHDVADRDPASGVNSR